MEKRKLLKVNRGGFMKFKVAFSIGDETFFVYSAGQIIESNLSEDAATRLAQFLNSHEYLATDKKAKSRNPLPKEKFDFDVIYDIYPRKIGKKSGLETLRKKVTSKEKYELLYLAVQNYAEQTKDVEEAYIKHFSTWTNSWEDYIPENVMTNLSESQQMSLDQITQMMDN